MFRHAVVPLSVFPFHTVGLVEALVFICLNMRVVLIDVSVVSIDFVSLFALLFCFNLFTASSALL